MFSYKTFKLASNMIDRFDCFILSGAIGVGLSAILFSILQAILINCKIDGEYNSERSDSSWCNSVFSLGEKLSSVEYFDWFIVHKFPTSEGAGSFVWAVNRIDIYFSAIAILIAFVIFQYKNCTGGIIDDHQCT